MNQNKEEIEYLKDEVLLLLAENKILSMEVKRLTDLLERERKRSYESERQTEY